MTEKNTKTLTVVWRLVPKQTQRMLCICCYTTTRMQGKIITFVCYKQIFKNVAHFKCLRMAVTNQNWIQEEIKID
jgi:hypothetical protein